MFRTGPDVVREVTGQRTSSKELGGARVHARNASVMMTKPVSVGDKLPPSTDVPVITEIGERVRRAAHHRGDAAAHRSSAA